MAKIKFQSFAARLTGPMNVWRALGSLNAANIQAEANRGFTIALVGEPQHTTVMESRLRLETLRPLDGSTGPPDLGQYVQKFLSAEEVPADHIVLDCSILPGNEETLAETLAQIVEKNGSVRISLARHIPAFRPAVCSYLIYEASWQNARIAVFSSLPAVIPITAILAPAAALGDMVVLTRNQGVLLLKLAAVYGHEADVKACMTELMPIVGGAFGWRAVARELVGMVPGGIGIVVKGSIAFAGTYTVGKAAAVFYSTGHALSKNRLDRIYSEAYKNTKVKIGALMQQRASKSRPLVHAGPETASEASSTVGVSQHGTLGDAHERSDDTYRELTNT